MIITMTDNNSNDYMIINDDYKDYNGYDNTKNNNNKYDNND